MDFSTVALELSSGEGKVTPFSRGASPEKVTEKYVQIVFNA